MDIQELINALDYIVNTFTRLKEQAEEVGGKFDGYAAIRLADNPHHLRDKAQQILRELPEDLGDISIGRYTFNDLRRQHALLSSIVFNVFKEKAWKYRVCSNADALNQVFIAGIELEDGYFIYYYHLEYWNMFNVKEVKKAPEDNWCRFGDVTSLFSLLD